MGCYDSIRRAIKMSTPCQFSANKPQGNSIRDITDWCSYPRVHDYIVICLRPVALWIDALKQGVIYEWKLDLLLIITPFSFCIHVMWVYYVKGITRSHGNPHTQQEMIPSTWWKIENKIRTRKKHIASCCCSSSIKRCNNTTFWIVQEKYFNFINFKFCGINPAVFCSKRESVTKLHQANSFTRCGLKSLEKSLTHFFLQVPAGGGGVPDILQLANFFQILISQLRNHLLLEMIRIVGLCISHRFVFEKINKKLFSL